MILVTVGTQLPFNRLVGAVSEWARANGRTDVVFQDANGSVSLEGFRHDAFLAADELERLMQQADVVVSHVGMGTILSCLELGRPLIAMPRRASLGEHRNEHQLATAQRFRSRQGISIAWDEAEIAALLQKADALKAGRRIDPIASPELIAAVREFVVGRKDTPR